ncbi:MAG: hypothetical protein ACXAD7_28130 [Candidatus Kariarchaeaceae archaeon]|jgi:hypothetical protein
MTVKLYEEECWTYNAKGREVSAMAHHSLKDLVDKVVTEGYDLAHAENIITAALSVAFCEAKLNFRVPKN